MKKISLVFEALLVVLFVAGCDGTPPPAPQPHGSGEKLGQQGATSNAPHRVTILPLRH